MECISYYFRVFGADIYREIFAYNRFAARKTLFFTIRTLKKKITRAMQADLQASTASPVRLRNVSRQLIYSRKSTASESVLKTGDSEIGSYRQRSTTTQNRSCTTNDLICPRDSVPVVFRLYDGGTGGRWGRVRYFAASPAIINGDRCAGPTNSEPIVHCDDGDGCGRKGCGQSGFNIRVCRAYTGH